MHDRFKTVCDALHSKFETLVRMPACTIATAEGTPIGGIYMFSEDDRHLYVGRTKRRIGVRLKNHVSTADDCPFAFRLAREATGHTESRYSGNRTRDKLLADPGFRSAYEAAKNRIRRMQVRWVDEADPVRQTLLEVYVSVVLGTPHNDFDTH